MNRDAPDLAIQTPIAGTYGNLCFAVATITLAAASIADVFRFLRLPAHTRLVDAFEIHSASSASTTMKFGYLPTDGSAGDDDYFMAAKSLAAAAKNRADAANAPKVVDEEVHIVGTLAGAAIATETTITVGVFYEYLGD